MMTQSIPLQRWIELNWQIRTQLAKDLNVSKSKDTVLMDGKVVSDGRTQDDIDNSLTVEALQEYTGSSSENIFELFEKAISKAEYVIYMKDDKNIKEDVKVAETSFHDEIPVCATEVVIKEINEKVEKLKAKAINTIDREQLVDAGLIEEIPTNFMQLKKYAKEKGIDTSIYKTKKDILEQLNK